MPPPAPAPPSDPRSSSPSPPPTPNRPGSPGPDNAPSTPSASPPQLDLSSAPPTTSPLSPPAAAPHLSPQNRRVSLKAKHPGVIVIEGPLGGGAVDLHLEDGDGRGGGGPPSDSVAVIRLPERRDLPERRAEQSALAREADLSETMRIPSATVWQRGMDVADSYLGRGAGAAAAGGLGGSAGGSVMTDDTLGLSLNLPSASFNSLGSSQRPLVVERLDSNTSGTQDPGTLESGMSRPSWKKGSGRVSNFEKTRLAALGFEEELTRDFDFWANWGVALSNIGFLPGTFLGVLTALETGGGSMYAIAWPVSGLFMVALAAVLGEMASAYPVAGAMFTWVFRLCRSSRRFDSLARYASWITGSFLLCSHVLTQIVLTYQLSTFFQGFIGLYNDKFEPTFWRSMGIAWAILALTGLLVTSSFSRSPWLWRLCGAGTVIGFVITNVCLLALAPTIRPASEIFLSYGNNTGWSSHSYVYMIGWVLTCVASGVEACSHMAEDTKTPARTVPMAMFWSVATSYGLGWISICVLLATQQSEGRDPNLVSSIGMLANTLPRPYTTLVTIIILLAMVAQNVAQLLATSRFIWALAHESALPFSQFLHTISARQGQPIRAIWLVVAIVALSLLLIRISTQIIATILLEGAGWCVMFAYLVPVAIYLIGPDDALVGDGRAQWTLRKFSKPLGYAGATFACVFLVVLCLPTGYPINSINASYASIVAIGVLLLSSLSWVFYGNARYAGPIKTTTRWTIGAEVELPASTTFKSATLPDETTSAAHGRSAHVFSSFPTLMTNSGPPSVRHGGEGAFSEGGETTTGTGDWSSSGGEDSRGVGSEGGMAMGELARQRGRWAAGSSADDGVRGRERSANGSRFEGVPFHIGGGSPTASTP